MRARLGPDPLKKRSERGGAGFRLVLHKLIEGEVACGDGDGGQTVGAGGGDIGGGVADDADGGLGAGMAVSLANGVSDHVRPELVVVAETPEAEPAAQAEDFDLEPADGFEIAGGYSQSGALAFEIGQHFVDAGHLDQLHLCAAGKDIAAHGLENICKMRLPVRLVELSQTEGVTENAGIGVAAEDDAVEDEFVSHD